MLQTTDLTALRDQLASSVDRDDNPLPAALPGSWHELRLVRGGTLLTPDGALTLTRLGKGMFSDVYSVAEKPGRVIALSHPEAHEKEIAQQAHEADPQNPHLPAIERLGTLTDDRQVFEMPMYTTPFRLGNATPASAAAYKALLRVLKNFPIDPFETPRSHATRLAERAMVLVKDERVAEAFAALMDQSANYGENYAVEMSPRNVATDAHGNLVLLDLLFDRKLNLRLHAKRAEARERAAPYRFGNPLPPDARAPGLRHFAALFTFEPLRGQLAGWWYERVGVYGAEVEPEGDHYRVKPAAERQVVERLASEGRLKGHDPRRVVLYGLYERLSYEEARGQVYKLLGSAYLAKHVRLVVAAMKHTVRIDPQHLKAAGLPTRASFDEVLAAGLGPHVAVGEATFSVHVVEADLERLCDDIAAHDDHGQAVLEVVTGASREEADQKAEQKRRELYEALRYKAAETGDLHAVRVKATRYTTFRGPQCDASWA